MRKLTECQRFARPDKNTKTPIWRVFSKTSSFSLLKCCVHVDRRPNCREKTVFKNIQIRLDGPKFHLENPEKAGPDIVDLFWFYL